MKTEPEVSQVSGLPCTEFVEVEEAARKHPDYPSHIHEGEAAFRDLGLRVTLGLSAAWNLGLPHWGENGLAGLFVYALCGDCTRRKGKAEKVDQCVPFDLGDGACGFTAQLLAAHARALANTEAASTAIRYCSTEFRDWLDSLFPLQIDRDALLAVIGVSAYADALAQMFPPEPNREKLQAVISKGLVLMPRSPASEKGIVVH